MGNRALDKNNAIYRVLNMLEPYREGVTSLSNLKGVSLIVLIKERQEE